MCKAESFIVLLMSFLTCFMHTDALTLQTWCGVLLMQGDDNGRAGTAHALLTLSMHTHALTLQMWFVVWSLQNADNARAGIAYVLVVPRVVQAYCCFDNANMVCCFVTAIMTMVTQYDCRMLTAIGQGPLVCCSWIMSLPTC